MTSIPNHLRLIPELTKLRITAAVALTGAAGYVLAARLVEWEMALLLLGVFVLACGAAALNQWQEREIDSLMKRTRTRPIPSGRMDPLWALFISVTLLLLGLYCLASAKRNPNILLALGGFAVVWYNGIYTYLKRLTAFAVVPGALIGAIPPALGYVAGGGSLFDPGIVLVALFFFIWQIPHFWLLLLMIGGEYRAAGLPTVTDKLSQAQLVRITFIWMLATACAGLALPVFDRVAKTLPWSLGLAGASLWLAVKAANVLRSGVGGDGAPAVRRAFWHVNAFALIVTLCMSLGALLGPAG